MQLRSQVGDDPIGMLYEKSLVGATTPDCGQARGMHEGARELREREARAGSANLTLTLEGRAVMVKTRPPYDLRD